MLITRQHLMYLMRTNKLYANKTVNCFSLERFNDEYETYTEKFTRLRQGYRVDSEGLIRTKTAPTLNFDQMKSLFLSKDLSLLEKHKDWFEPPSKYLDGKINMDGDRVTFLTFARCGSTFLRK